MTLFEVYGESGGTARPTLQGAVELLIQLREQALLAREETDLAIQEVEYDAGVPIRHRPMTINADWILEPGKILHALKHRQWAWGKWEAV